MKKTIYALMLLVFTLASCDKNNDENNNGSGNPDGGGNSEILNKKIATISGDGDIMSFMYDSQNRVSSIYFNGEKGVTFNYISNDKILIDNFGDKEEYILSNKRAVSLNTGNGTSIFKYNSEGYMINEDDCNYTWENDNLKLIKPQKDASSEIIYGNQKNNLNLDLLPLILEFEYLDEYATMLGFGSKRSKNLPIKKMTSGNIEDETTYTYITDKDGYITTIKYKSEYDNVTLNFTYK